MAVYGVLGPHPATQGCVPSVTLGYISCPRRVCCWGRASAPFPLAWPLALAPGNRAAPQTDVGVGWNGVLELRAHAHLCLRPYRPGWPWPLPTPGAPHVSVQGALLSSLNGVALPAHVTTINQFHSPSLFPGWKALVCFGLAFFLPMDVCLPTQCRDHTHPPGLAQLVADAQ